MKKRFLLILTMTVAAAIGTVAVPVIQDSQNELSSKQALSLVRTINTVQAIIKRSRSNYGSLQDVVKPEFQLDKSLSIISSDGSSATVKDYRLSLVASVDGQHYQISLHPISGCGVSFFTNESGVIYQGKALGCPTP